MEPVELIRVVALRTGKLKPAEFKLREGETVRPYEGSADAASTTSPVRAPVIVPASPKTARNLS